MRGDPRRDARAGDPRNGGPPRDRSVRASPAGRLRQGDRTRHESVHDGGRWRIGAALELRDPLGAEFCRRRRGGPADGGGAGRAGGGAGCRALPGAEGSEPAALSLDRRARRRDRRRGEERARDRLRRRFGPRTRSQRGSGADRAGVCGTQTFRRCVRSAGAHADGPLGPRGSRAHLLVRAIPQFRFRPRPGPGGARSPKPAAASSSKARRRSGR